MRRQHIYLSMACRNPRRGLMCEPPAIKRIDFYCHSDLSLAGFIVAAAPHAQKKCQVRHVLFCTALCCGGYGMRTSIKVAAVYMQELRCAVANTWAGCVSPKKKNSSQACSN
eukprot:GHRQ01040208.1.p2 GENE.GHRQ01040208.1~~GHRQ01040208.1.p2  ORF type:complete len:112 (-),score=34.02 GHRQ01040208.1:307-642(-)